jgi:transcriptional regulator with XRE-family HTH domain
MEDLAVGRLFRELRVRLGWTQRMVATRARISTSAYSLIERGRIEGVPIGKIRRVGAVLEVRLVLEPRWRGAAVDRLLSSRHASMTEVIAAMLMELAWEVRPEVSFAHFGERGVVDLVAWHAGTRTLLLVELKTELVDANELLAVTDRRRRLAHVIADPFGWHPQHVGEWVVVADSRTNRRRLAAVRTALRAALPSTGHQVRAWLRRPSGAIAALSFLPDAHGIRDSQRHAPRLRVRPSRASVGGADKAA